MSKIKILLIAFIGLGLIGSIVGYNYYAKIYSSNVSDDFTLYIASDSDFETVLDSLSKNLNDVNSFKWVAEKKNYPNKIKSGKYDISKGLNNNELVNILRSGQQTPVFVIFNNQDRLEKLAGRISKQIEADSISLLRAFSDPVFLSKNNITKENALSIYIPNKYEFYWNTSAEAFRKRMFNEFNKFWSEEKIKQAKEQGLNKFEVITLASIVQKETANPSERPIVAGLYLNRIHKGWALQADPTIIFVIKEKYGQDRVIKRVLYKDLEIDSKYNTYKYKGLPPGPIAMPDISSIKAILRPSKHDYFYMCADIETLNNHVFAKTKREHDKNAQKYRQWLDKQGVNR